MVVQIADFPPVSDLRAEVRRATLMDEGRALEILLNAARSDTPMTQSIGRQAQRLVAAVRTHMNEAGSLDAFLHEYELSTREGVVLMCLAEALLRVPDAETANLLIKDKLSGGDWEDHLGNSGSVFVNASTWALMLTGKVMRLETPEMGELPGFFAKLVSRSGEPVIRQAMTRAMRIMGRQFVMGRTIGEALKRAEDERERGYRHSFDMLGEAAMTAADAARYFDSYADAIQAVGKAAGGAGPIEAPGVSVKLSALHPRYELAQKERVMRELLPRVVQLARLAKDAGIGFCIDAEEADRLDLSMDVIEAAALDGSLAGWDGLGLAIQAYQKRAYPLIDWLADVARRGNRRLMARLVKGAYWDTEIKRAQEQGLDGYPVFTRKASTDVSYLACAKKLFDYPEAFYPQFATHNAHSIAAVSAYAGDKPFEFQRLHGMGGQLYDEVVGDRRKPAPCRVYAPVGSHKDLLAYLVRRLLENGANTSFVNRIANEREPVEAIVADPVAQTAALEKKPHRGIPAPRDLFAGDRLSGLGVDMGNPASLRRLAAEMASAPESWQAAPSGGGGGEAAPVRSPRDRNDIPGEVWNAGPDDVERALGRAASASHDWDGLAPAERSACLVRAADAVEEAAPELMTLLVREAGKTIPDALADVREAVDFLRFYGVEAERRFARPVPMPGPTGESNQVRLHGRGVFVCVSPWNFPLAIFLGQVSAALAAGNAVIAKPAEQTPLIAARAVKILHEAGVPEEVLHLLPGDGLSVGAPLVADNRVSGVAFTGSTETAWAINQALAARRGPIAPLIAETGGQNAMIVDSTALPEQVVGDAVFSAFRSAGQRCSALRVLFVQRDIADGLIDMLKGATEELRVGDPALLATDVGPVIDEAAKGLLDIHIERMEREAKCLCRASLEHSHPDGVFFAPAAYELDSLDRLTGEVFGPVMHVIRYSAGKLDAVVDAINGTGFGLTLGVHSRVDATVERIISRARVGNCYVNRNQIGASVGVQPFGGEGLSGTGPKAGGHHYLQRFATERTITVNTAAAGGNAELMTLNE